ncbi:MAG: PAS domain S-box protein [Deltaproteobacteria bacterium]|nr:PAS domain S-box protein [Candidatus Zymogenaceae bacterium]
MRRILIVDDSPLILAQLRDTLVSLNYDVVGSATSGSEAVDLAQTLRPDTILMDIIMPGEMDGIAAARVIHEELDIPIIFLTGSQAVDVIQRVKESGAYGYIEKPIKQNEIGAAIEIALQRKQSVRKIRDLYENIVENTNDIIYVLDARGNIIFLNRAACQGFGEALDRLIGRNFKDLVTPESYKYATQLHKRQLGGEDIGAFELELYDTDKNIRIIEARERLIWDNGKVVEIHGIGRDVTERKVSEDALKKSEERYRIISENMQDSVWLLDKNLRPVFVSPSVERARGYTFEEIKELPLEKNLTPDSFDLIVKAIVAMMTKAKANTNETAITEVMNLEWYRKDGTTYWTEVSLTLIPDEKGNPVEVLGVGRDITERMLNEKALRESEERYRALFEDASFGIFHSTVEGKFIRVNAALAEILGYDSPEDVISSINDFRSDLYIDPADRDRAIQEIARQKGRGYFDAPWRRKDGTVITARVHIRLVFAPDGEFKYVEGFLEDVTEERNAREQILYLKEFNETIINSMVDSIDIIDKDYTIIFQNSSANKIYGEGVGKKCFYFYHARKIPCEYCMAPKAVAEKKCLSREVELEDGTYLEVHSSPIKMPDGTFCSMEIMRDITKRKHAELSLRDSEQRFRLLAENANDVIFTADMDMRFTYISSSVTHLRGFTVEEAMAQTAAEVLTPTSMELAASSLREELKIETGGTGNPTRMRMLEMEETCKDGSTVWTETTLSFLRDEKGLPTGILGMTRDISERRRAEEALRESEEKFRNLFETSRDLLYIATIDGEILEYSKSAKDFFGYTDEEFSKMNLREHYVYPEERERFVRKVLDEGFIENYELKLKRKDGTPIDALVTVVPRRDRNGAITGLQGAVKDITKMKRLEQQLLQSEKLSGLGTMISGIAHELNNPLTVIMGNTELMLMDKSKPSKDIKSLDVIFKESERAAKIVSGLLTFAREHRPERGMVNVNDIIIESYKLREYNLMTNNIEVTLSLSADIPPTLADPYQLQQVFTNIIHNARDALMEKQGGSLIVRSFHKEQNIIVEFEDNGPGIRSDDLKRIFDPFFTTKDVGKGTGLGLSMAYGIINEHGGTIEVESQFSRGAKFTVELPIIHGSDYNVMIHDAPGDAPTVGKSILIVDDERYIRDLLKEVLSERGHTVKIVSTADDAIQLLEKNKYDAVVIDIKMPGMGGKELYAHFQKKPEFTKMMLFITGDILGDDTRTFFETTGCRYIEKPFKINTFIRALNDVLDT